MERNNEKLKKQIFVFKFKKQHEQRNNTAKQNLKERRKKMN